MKIRKTIDAAVCFAARVAGRGWRKACALAPRRAPVRIRFERRVLTVAVLAQASATPGLHVFPRDSKHGMQVTQQGSALHICVDSAAGTTIDLGTAELAEATLWRLQRKLLSNRTLVWSGRIVALAIVWLLVSSYQQVREQQRLQLAGQPSAATPPLAALPDVDSGLVDVPSMTPSVASPVDPATVETPSPMSQAPTPASVPVETPAPAPADGGLSGFGLKLGAEGTPPEVPAAAPGTVSTDSTADVSQGPGCDPSLAFKAPAR